MREKILNAATVFMVCVAVASTGYTMMRRNSPPTADAAVVAVPQGDWRNYAIGGHVFGPADAPVTIVEFADFQCPFCEQLKWVIDSLRTLHPNDVRFVFRHFPLRGHGSAIPAAVASECAHQQGRFEAMFDKLYTHQDSLGVAPYVWFARSAGVTDLSAFETCMGASQHVDAIARDTLDAIRLALSGTPSLLINETRIQGALSLDSLEYYVARAKAMNAR